MPLIRLPICSNHAQQHFGCFRREDQRCEGEDLVQDAARYTDYGEVCVPWMQPDQIPVVLDLVCQEQKTITKACAYQLEAFLPREKTAKANP